MKYLYYPGCSVKSTGKAYEKSLIAVFAALGVELVELEDWNCCGATACLSVNEMESFALAGRNLAIAEAMAAGEKLDLVAPCSACYLILNKAQRTMAEHRQVAERVGAALNVIGLNYTGAMRIRHPLDVLVNDIGLEAVAARVTHPLKDLKVAPYYGCQIVRPYSTFDDQHNPTTMDLLLKAAGAEVVDYPLKTKCCGASLTGTVTEVALPMLHQLLTEAKKKEADVIATICPLCQFNLDGYQDRVAVRYGHDTKPAGAVPVLYLTQLLGLAFGIQARELDLQRGIVPAEPALARRGLVYA